MQREDVLRRRSLHPNISDVPGDCVVYFRIRNAPANRRADPHAGSRPPPGGRILSRGVPFALARPPRRRPQRACRDHHDLLLASRGAGEPLARGIVPTKSGTFTKGVLSSCWSLHPDLGTIERARLAAVGNGQRPVQTVPAGWWQAARPIGEYALAECTVGPGFEYEDFRFLADDPLALEKIHALAPELAQLA